MLSFTLLFTYTSYLYFFEECTYICVTRKGSIVNESDHSHWELITDRYCLLPKWNVWSVKKSHKEIVLQGLKINVKATRKISALPFEIFLVITHYFEHSDIRKNLYMCYGLFIFVWTCLLWGLFLKVFVLFGDICYQIIKWYKHLWKRNW